MSIVVNSGAILALFDQLGWKTSRQDLLQDALNSGVPVAAIDAYLAALVVTPDGLDDQTVPGCDPLQADAITAFLKERGLVGT